MNEDELFQALDNPVRRAILRLLQTGAMSAGDIWAHFEISQPSISRHLDILRHAGLISSRRLGNQIIYARNSAAAERAADLLRGFFPAH